MRTSTFAYLVIISIQVARASEPDTSAYLFDASYAKWVSTPTNVQFVNDIADSSGLYRVVSVDLNTDGIQENLFVSLCGTGGCVFEIHDGRTGNYLGEFFGSPIIVLAETVNGMPVVQSYSHNSADGGDFTCYVYTGREYVVVSSVRLFDKTVTNFFSSINKIQWLHR